MFSTKFNKACSLTLISKRNHASFQSLLESRRHEADCTVLIENPREPNEHHHMELVDFCSKFGNLSKVFWFVSKNRTSEANMYLVRFDSPAAASALLQACPHKMNFRGSIPTNTRQLLFTPLRNSSNSPARLPLQFEKQDLEFSTQLHQASSVSEQIQLIYESEKQTDLDVSMRFFICRQIEGLLGGLWSRLAVLPFGSSINSFGRRPSDLDMAMSLNYESSSSSKSCLQHVDLGQQLTEWSHAKDMVPKLAEIFRLVPAFERPVYILARVPILTFRHRSLPVECDLSIANLSGLYMSELLFTLAELDPRVRPLVFAVRSWAKENQITRPRPSHTPSSFMLTLLTIFFLQQESVVPPLSYLLNGRSPKDTAYLDHNPNIDILKQNIQWKSSNTDNLETLLGKFLDYYVTFPFEEKGICVVKGHMVPKPERCAMYMVNPLNPTLNASKNVGYMELGRLIKRLQTHAQHFPHLQGPQQASEWGLMELLNGAGGASEVLSMGKGFQVSSLFQEQRQTKAS